MEVEQIQATDQGLLYVILPANVELIFFVRYLLNIVSLGFDHKKINFSPSHSLLCRGSTPYFNHLLVRIPCKTICNSVSGYNIHPPFVGHVNGMHPLKQLSVINEDQRWKEKAVSKL